MPLLQVPSKGGLQFPVDRIRRLWKGDNYVGTGAGKLTCLLYIQHIRQSTVLVYLVAEILELGGKATRNNNEHRIVPCHLHFTV